MAIIEMLEALDAHEFDPLEIDESLEGALHDLAESHYAGFGGGWDCE